MLRGLFGLVLVLFFFLSAAEESPPVNVQSMPAPEARSRDWGFGASVGGDRSWGLKAEKTWSPKWLASLAFYTRGGNCCSGGNPTADIPYGFEISEFRRNTIQLIVGRTWSFGSTGQWSLLAGAGVGYVMTNSTAQFYNAAFIGYDKKSPVNSSSVGQQRWILPAQVGLRRKIELGSFPVLLSLLADFPLNGESDLPGYTALNGRKAYPSRFSFIDGAVRLEAALFL